MTTSQIGSANQEYQNILTEIGDIGSTTNFNGTTVFSSTASNFVVSDGTSSGTNTYADTVGVLTSASVGTTSGGGGQSFTGSGVATLTASTATAVMEAATTAIGDVAYQRGAVGADINELTAAGNVAGTENENLASAANTILSTDYGQATSQMAKYQVLSQTGIAALAQANSVQQEVLKLLQ
jgi:flagellin